MHRVLHHQKPLVAKDRQLLQLAGQPIEHEADPVFVHSLVEDCSLDLGQVTECELLGVFEVSTEGRRLRDQGGATRFREHQVSAVWGPGVLGPRWQVADRWRHGRRTATVGQQGLRAFVGLPLFGRVFLCFYRGVLILLLLLLLV